MGIRFNKQWAPIRVTGRRRRCKPYKTGTNVEALKQSKLDNTTRVWGQKTCQCGGRRNWNMSRRNLFYRGRGGGT